MSFPTKYFTATTSGTTSDGTSSGKFSAFISGDVNGALSGTWSYSGTYNDPSVNNFHDNISGNVLFSGTIAGSLVQGSDHLWSVHYLSADSRLKPSGHGTTNGFLQLFDGIFSLDVGLVFDIPYVTKLGGSSYDTFASRLNNIATSSLPPIISIDSYTGSVPENASLISVVLKRSGTDLSSTSSVTLSTEDGAAVSIGTHPDFIAVNQVITFRAGESSVTVPLNIILFDNIPENNENFGLRLSAPVNATLGFQTGNVTIVDSASAIDSLAHSADQVFSWAESIYANLFPDHPASQEISGYHARLYSSGMALGEKDGRIYLYDGHSITSVGTVDSYLHIAIAAGF